MTAVRWILYGMVKKALPDVEIHLTYGAATKVRRKELDIKKSHVNDAFVMGNFHPGHRARPQIYQKSGETTGAWKNFMMQSTSTPAPGKNRLASSCQTAGSAGTIRKIRKTSTNTGGRRCLPEKGRSERYVIKSRRMTLYGTGAGNTKRQAAIIMGPG